MCVSQCLHEWICVSVSFLVHFLSSLYADSSCSFTFMLWKIWDRWRWWQIHHFFGCFLFSLSLPHSPSSSLYHQPSSSAWRLTSSRSPPDDIKHETGGYGGGVLCSSPSLFPFRHCPPVLPVCVLFSPQFVGPQRCVYQRTETETPDRTGLRREINLSEKNLSQVEAKVERPARVHRCCWHGADVSCRGGYFLTFHDVIARVSTSQARVETLYF